MPKVSILLPSYNHEAFVAQSIQSALDQSFDDFELLIIDDGSQDKTPDIVRTFKDPRIQFSPYRVNRGACAVGNELITKATGQFVTFLCSDDYWPSDRLEWQIRFLKEHRECHAILGQVSFVGRNGEPVVPTDCSPDIFKQENRNRGRWLRRLLHGGNCLSHSSMLMYRECYARMGLYDNRMRQIPDYDMWIRFLKNYQFHVSDRVLVYNRILPGENASDGKQENRIRGMNEFFFISQTFFNDMSKELLIEGFEDHLTFKNPPTEEHLEIEKALILARSLSFKRMHHIVGMIKLFDLLKSPAHREILARDYNYTDLDFQKLAGESEAFLDP